MGVKGIDLGLGILVACRGGKEAS